MTTLDETQGIYRQHRDNQHERILEAAEELFIRDGIDNVSMSGIADAARMSRKTLYKYFPDKEEIAWAIYEKIIDQLSATFPRQPQANGYEQLTQLAAWAVDQLVTSWTRQRFFAQVDTLYARETSADRMRRITNRSGSGGVDWVAGIVRQGIADGSLRADLDPELTAATLLNLFSGMNSRFALLGDLIHEECGYAAPAIYREICDVFLRGLQSQP